MNTGRRYRKIAMWSCHGVGARTGPRIATTAGRLFRIGAPSRHTISAEPRPAAARLVPELTVSDIVASRAF